MDGPYIKYLIHPNDCATIVHLIKHCEMHGPVLNKTDNRVEVQIRDLQDTSALADHPGLEQLKQIRYKVIVECNRVFFGQTLKVEGREFTCTRLFPEFSILAGNHPGDCHTRHSDNSKHDDEKGWQPNHTSIRAVSALLYLNEGGSDFTGGDLVFPALKFRITPQPGLLVAYPSDERFEHEVPAIESGFRCSMPVWFTCDIGHAEKF